MLTEQPALCQRSCHARELHRAGGRKTKLAMTVVRDHDAERCRRLKRVPKLQISFASCPYDRLNPRHQRACADRGMRRQFLPAAARRAFSARLSYAGFRRDRTLRQFAHPDEPARRCELPGHTGFCVAGVPARRHLHPHRPRHSHAGGSAWQDRRGSGVSDDRRVVDTRHSFRRIRRQDLGHPLAQRWAPASGPRERTPISLPRASSSRLLRPTRPCPACSPMARSMR